MAEIVRSEVGPFFSQIVTHGEVVYLAGQVDPAASATVAEQSRAIFARIDELLASVGSDRSKLLTTVIHLVSIDDFAEMNEQWVAWLDGVGLPVRTTVEAALAKPEFLVEVTVTAAR